MKNYSALFRALVFVSGLLFGHAASASPVICSLGYADSTCIEPLQSGWQAPPTCSTAAGWTTLSPATWAGSHYTSPQCNYQAPPSCPTEAGYITTAYPSWNGSTWVGLLCAFVPEPGANTCPDGFAVSPYWTGSSWAYTCNAPPDPANICNAFFATQGYDGNFTDDDFGPVNGELEGSAYSTGPEYDNGSYLTNVYGGYCWVDPTTGAVLSWQVIESSVGGA